MTGSDILTKKPFQGFIFDVTGRAVVQLEGLDGQDLLQRLSTNDLSKLTNGKAIQTVLTNEKGRVIDVVAVIKIEEHRLLLVGQSREASTLLRWLEKFIIMEDAKVESQSGFYKHFLVFGLAEDIARQLRYEGKLQSDAIIFNEQWNDVSLMHFLVEHSKSESLLHQLEQASCVVTDQKEFERFRVQNHIPASLAELTEEYNPLELNLRHLISWTKGCYIGQEVIARLDTYKKVQRRLVGVRLEEMPVSIPQIIFNKTEEIGVMTSVVEMGKSNFVGLGYIRVGVSEFDRNFFIKNNGRQIPVFVSKERLS